MADRKSAGSSASRRSKTSDHSIGQFLIGAEIGKGSFAQVYSGTHQVGPSLESVPVHTLYRRICTLLYKSLQL